MHLRLLLQLGGYSEEGSKVFWSCTSCEAVWCAFCGKHMPVGRSKSDRNKMHMHCKGQWKFMVYRCMVDLEEARTILTQGHQVTQISSCLFPSIKLSCTLNSPCFTMSKFVSCCVRIVL